MHRKRGDGTAWIEYLLCPCVGVDFMWLISPELMHVHTNVLTHGNIHTIIHVQMHAHSLTFYNLKPTHQG